ncbi:hypothetical protein [Ruegeria arenilitoris]|uniref:hypothetical protein n=1 Tax=Ruegeria arenilitoris TaxID=1173585 RepID=UPI00147F7454|nr:hypothetical protein [Ruegeria arenilitoris]
MTDLRDGFLYHPDGDSATDQLRRLVAGEYNLSLDDLFSSTLDEADEAILKAEQEHLKAEEALRRLEVKVRSLRERKVEVESAIREFETSGEINEVLYPECHKLLAAERREFSSADAEAKASEIEKAETAVAGALGSGWDVEDTHADDEFVYVTVKRKRVKAPTTPRPTRDTIIEKVRQAFDVYGDAFKNRVKPARLASVVVGRPRAP